MNRKPTVMSFLQQMLSQTPDIRYTNSPLVSPQPFTILSEFSMPLLTNWLK
ncbi:uncharacterized protein DS421_8g225840 [Arachis hypogaea]|nr:uncharacterized protein DS421_8g225840 [Arachis hypogaea]